MIFSFLCTYIKTYKELLAGYEQPQSNADADLPKHDIQQEWLFLNRSS